MQVHSFPVPNPMKWWKLTGTEKTADFYDFLYKSEEDEVFFFFRKERNDEQEVDLTRFAILDLADPALKDEISKQCKTATEKVKRNCSRLIKIPDDHCLQQMLSTQNKGLMKRDSKGSIVTLSQP